MRIALFQGPAGPTDPAGNLRRLAQAAQEAAGQGARLLICPEMFLTGYNIGAAMIRELAEPADGPAARRVAQVAADSGLAVLYGYPERDGETVYNAVQLIDRDGGRQAGYRKSHLYSDLDRRVFCPGHGDCVQATLDGLRIGLLICYDVEFPETVRTHALAGTELLVVPTALMRPYEIVTRAVVPARAFENAMYIAYVNRCDTEGELVYCGESCLAGPEGRDRVRAGAGEQLLVADVDPAVLQATRRTSTHLADRRPELYGTLTAPLTASAGTVGPGGGTGAGREEPR